MGVKLGGKTHWTGGERLVGGRRRTLGCNKEAGRAGVHMGVEKDDGFPSTQLSYFFNILLPYKISLSVVRRGRGI